VLKPAVASGERVVLAQPDAFALTAYLAVAHARTTVVHTAADAAAFPPAAFADALVVESGALDDTNVDWACSVVLCAAGRADEALHALCGATARLAQRGAIVVATCPGIDPRELAECLGAAGAGVAFAGMTLSDNFVRARTVAVAIVDARLGASLRARPAPDRRPLGVMACYNDADVIRQIVAAHVDDGLDVHLIDNWSGDGTYEIVRALERELPARVTVERWPADGPADRYRWTELLRRKAEIGARHPGRWIVHIDSDELWRSPWDGCSLADAFGVAQDYGANTVGASMFTFVPTRDGFGAAEDPLSFFTGFTYAPHDSYDMLLRAWRQPDHVVDLASCGGHEAKFAGRNVFPYHFPLFHFPFRSEEQARRKIYRDRLPRFVRSERDRGWHAHFADIRFGDRFIALPELLHAYDPASFRANYLVEIVSDAVRRRRNGSLIV
jgi:hypothetical protein